MSRRLLVCPVLLFALAVPAAGQKPAPIKDNPEIPNKIKALVEILKDTKAGRKGGARDEEAKGVITNLLNLAKPGLSKKDRIAVLRVLDKTLKVRPTREPANIGLYRAAAATLGQLGGKDAAKVLRSVYDAKKPFPTKKEWVPMRVILLLELGKTKDQGQMKFLYDEASRSYQNSIKATAGQALGQFADAKYEDRREIVSKLLIEWGRQEGKALPIDPGNIEAQNAKETLAVITDKWRTTLAKLTRQRFLNFQDWNTWYNKNKNNRKAWGDA